MTAQDIYKFTMALVGEVDGDGEPAGEYAEEYKAPALRFIAAGATLGFMLRGERRSVSALTPDDEVPGDPGFLSSILPYFVGYNLVMDENPELYQKLRDEFNLLVGVYRQSGRAVSAPIEDLYGIEFLEGGRW